MRSAITFLNIQLSNSRVSYNKNFNSINMIAPSIFWKRQIIPNDLRCSFVSMLLITH